MEQVLYVKLLFLLHSTVSNISQIKLTKDGNVLLREMVRD